MAGPSGAPGSCTRLMRRCLLRSSCWLDRRPPGTKRRLTGGGRFGPRGSVGSRRDYARGVGLRAEAWRMGRCRGGCEDCCIAAALWGSTASLATLLLQRISGRRPTWRRSRDTWPSLAHKRTCRGGCEVRCLRAQCRAGSPCVIGRRGCRRDDRLVPNCQADVEGSVIGMHRTRQRIRRNAMTDPGSDHEHL